MTIHQVLTKYWGYSEFRPLQEDIISSVLAGRDTLALLPTGGGKSICFQVPAMAQEGLCIVFSPLIALMKDQVENLKKRNIPAVAVYSGMHHNEIDIVLNNCIYGKTKMLYMSPERLKSANVQSHIKEMKINLIAVDEAHCISQWGYDFRPSYLELTDIRELKPDVPIIALTATATPEVVNDIQQKLKFKEENVMQKSFERKNLSYVVLDEEDKHGRLLKIAGKVKGTGIVYVRNRKKTKEIARFLVKNKISADYYHAGLDHAQRDAKQAAWTSGRCRIIVSTNAFGMGIDKSNVRFVTHLDLPDSIESYFQEAGRAGRDEKKAYAVLLYNKSDKLDLEERIKTSYPPEADIKKTYEALCNYFRVPVESGEGTKFDFSIGDFCKQYNMQILNVFNCIKFLEKEGYISATEALFTPSKIHFNIGKQELYEFQVAQKHLDPFIKLLLRSYAGTFDDFIKISESEIARRAGIEESKAIRILQKLHETGVITYLPQNNMPQIIFQQNRIPAEYLVISKENYKDRKENAIEKMEAVIRYASVQNKCRSEVLLEYFGEKNTYRCGLCDICLERNKLQLSRLEFDAVLEEVKPILMSSPKTLGELVNSLKVPENKTIKVIQWLVDNGKIKYSEEDKLIWHV